MTSPGKSRITAGDHGFFDMQPKRWTKLVDDNGEFLEMITAMAEKTPTWATIRERHTTDIGTGGIHGRAGAAEVVIDQQMTGMTGIELCGRLQVWRRCRKSSLTTGGGHFTREAAGKAGCSALLHKPFMFSGSHGRIGHEAGEELREQRFRPEEFYTLELKRTRMKTKMTMALGWQCPGHAGTGRECQDAGRTARGGPPEVMIQIACAGPAQERRQASSTDAGDHPRIGCEPRWDH